MYIEGVKFIDHCRFRICVFANRHLSSRHCPSSFSNISNVRKIIIIVVVVATQHQSPKLYRWMESNRFSFLALRHALPVVEMDNFLFKTRENLSPFRKIHIHDGCYMCYVCDSFCCWFERVAKRQHHFEKDRARWRRPSC